MKIEESVKIFVKERKEYYKQWIFEEPIIISKKHNDTLIRLQKIMYKLIFEFVTSYKKYKHLMPVDTITEQIIEIFNKKAYKVGTYRTDFVYDKNNQVKLIEITCRFALNGVFLSELMNSISVDFQKRKLNFLETKDFSKLISKYLEKTYLKGVKSIYILKGKDKKNESKIYKDIFTRMNYKVIDISYKEVENFIDSMQNSLIVSELSFDEIKSISLATIKKLMPHNIINDFRTIFLIHDKRFFSVLGKKELQESVLKPEEITFFNDFYIPTFTSSEEKKIWQNAKNEKNNWILKHRALGKSQKIYAGIVTEEKKWKSLFKEEEKKDMILQEWIPQNKIKGEIKGIKFNDFVTGTLLFFDNNYFGLGDFRTSSYPVTNKVDHRKACSLIRANNKKLDELVIKNYIH